MEVEVEMGEGMGEGIVSVRVVRRGVRKMSEINTYW
jgi:hypothetical protein